MTTLSMQQAADLAGVTRQAVTMWRRRSAGTATPLPPLDADGRLDAAEFVAWLEATGRGRNDQARVEAPRHGDTLQVAAARLDAVSALLLAHHALGEPLADVPADDVVDVLLDPAVSTVLDGSTLVGALADDALVELVDALAEAEYTPAAALDVVLEAAGVSAVEGVAEAPAFLSRAGMRLLAPVLAEITAERRVQPWGPAALALTVDAVRLVEERRVEVVCAPADDPWTRACHRRLVMAGADVSVADDVVPDATVVVVRPGAAADEGWFDELTELHLGLGDGGRAVVVGPAAVLVDKLPGGAGAARARFLVDARSGVIAPLRYVAALPRGLADGGGRRRLALWVLDAPSTVLDQVVYAEHAHAAADTAHGRTLAADVVSALDRVPTTRHTYVSAASADPGRLFTLGRLSLPVGPVVESDPARALADLWDAASRTDVVDVAAVAAGEPDRFVARVPWHDATRAGVLRLLPGARIDDRLCHAGPTASVKVLGPQEIRGERDPERHRLDRLVLAEHAPRARLTEPGDVVYVAAGVPAALVDREGGNVVQAPARIARCAKTESGRPCLVPRVLADDIRTSASSDPRTWRVRRLPAEAVALVADVGERADARRAELRRELAAIDAVEHHLVTGLVAGTLRPTGDTTTAGHEPAPTKEK